MLIIIISIKISIRIKFEILIFKFDLFLLSIISCLFLISVMNSFLNRIPVLIPSFLLEKQALRVLTLEIIVA